MFKHSQYLLAERRIQRAIGALAAIDPEKAAGYQEEFVGWRERTSGYARLMNLEACVKIDPVYDRKA